ncbi:MAG: hypothetical protein Q7T19_06510 [Caulobacter sp.]|nr:hypothetical protein [Caulobacter sp.]
MGGLSAYVDPMSGLRKSPDDETPLTAQQPGVEEVGAVFEPPVRDRWTIARERWDEHQRTGAATMSVDEFIAELTEEIEKRQAAKA